MFRIQLIAQQLNFVATLKLKSHISSNLVWLLLLNQVVIFQYENHESGKGQHDLDEM